MMMLRSQRQPSRTFWEHLSALPNDLQSHIMFDQMDVDGASTLRLVSPLFRDTFRMKDALKYVTMLLNNIVNVYGHLDSVRSLCFSDSLQIIDIMYDSIHAYISDDDVINFISKDSCINVDILLIDANAPPIDIFLHHSQIIFKELFILLADSTNGKYYNRYNTIHIVEIGTLMDVHIRINIKNSTQSATINGELIGLRNQ